MTKNTLQEVVNSINTEMRKYSLDDVVITLLLNDYEGTNIEYATLEWDVYMGDWKHEHMRSKWIVQEALMNALADENYGIELVQDEYGENDGSDTYCATHYCYLTRVAA